jgi:citrate lyase subunit beta / citryl-CoA lyase
MTTHARAWRSLMFVPGGRPDMVSKTPRWRPDAIVVDLEDAVAVQDKDRARATAVTAIRALPVSSGTTVLLRVNPGGTPWWSADLAALGECPGDGVVLPKLSGLHELDDARAVLGHAGRADALLVGGIETAAGVAAARALLAAGLSAAYFGAEDYVADVGGRRTRPGLEVLYARSEVCLAARLAGIPVVDQAVVAINDGEYFRADAEAGRAIGYSGKICIHPSQVAIAHQVFTPSMAEVSRARAVIEAARAGMGVLDGEMVDEAHVTMARSVLDRAGESG